MADAIITMALVLLAVAFIAALIFAATIEGQCLACGYPDSKIYGVNGYCVRTEDATEIVVPVEEACRR